MRLSNMEYEIMQIIWSKEESATSQDICTLSTLHGWKAPTVLSFLKRLCNKGMLDTYKIGKIRYYTPIVSKEEYARAETNDLIHELYDGKIVNLIANLAKQESLSEEERREIKNLLEDDWN